MNKDLARTSLDQRILSISDCRADLAIPRGGWIRAVRTSLGMTLEQLGRRLGVGRSSVLRMEQTERSGRIQLDSLRRVAEALGCELHYVFVPRRPLDETVAARRTELARKRLRATTHTMALEGQHDPDDPLARKLLEQAEASIRDRELWDDPA